MIDCAAELVVSLRNAGAPHAVVGVLESDEGEDIPMPHGSLWVLNDDAVG